MDSFADMYRPLAKRIAEAKEHMAFHGGEDQGLWPFQAFCLGVGELLDAASYKPLLLTTQEHLKEAYKHVLYHEQEHDALWPYQSFSMTVGELLEAAIYRFDPTFVSQARQKAKDVKTEYEKFKQDVYSYSSSSKDNILNL